mgnify:CR=1 FL=1
MKPKTTLTIGLLFLALSACSQGEAPGDGWKFDGGVPDADRDASQDTRSDTAQDMGRDTDPDTNTPPEPVETTVWLKNDTNRTLYVQEAANCRANPPAWTDWQSSGRAIDYCSICNCERIESGEGCRACPEACAIDQVQAVEPGTRVEWAWDGYRWTDDQVEGRNCERRSVPERGEQLQVKVCWGDSYTESGGPDEAGTVDDPTCEEVSFDYGTTEAGHTVQDDEADEGPPTFELENQTGQAIRVLTPSDCGSDQREWISVRGQQRMKVWSSCAECQCSSVNDSGQCLACGKACEGGQLKTIDPGQSRSYEWNGVGWAEAERNGTQCVQRVEPSPGEALTARFCWADETDGDFGIADMICEDVDFVFGQVAKVSHTIQ